MGAVEKSDNVKVRNKKRNSVFKNKLGKRAGLRNGNHPHPPSLLARPFPPFSPAMRPRPPFPPGRMPPPGPGMGPMPPPGMRMPPPCPPPLFRNRVPPPPRMGPRGPLPPMPMRPRPPLMGPPPLMRPPPPMMGPRRFPPRIPPPPPPMLPPNKMRQLKNKMHGKKNNKKKNGQNSIDLASPWVTPEIKAEFELKDKLFAAAKASSKPEDWDKFKEMRSKCDKMYKAAKLEYIGKHPEEDVNKIMAEVEILSKVENTKKIVASLEAAQPDSSNA